MSAPANGLSAFLMERGVALASWPTPFDGTPEQIAANRRTHYFAGERCMDCDCKPWHTAADYPCGAPVPRSYPQ